MTGDGKTQKSPQTFDKPKRPSSLQVMLPTRVGSLRFWRAAINGLPLPAFLLDPSHHVLAANRKMEELANLPASEYKGRRCWELFHGTNLITCPASCPFSKVVDFGRSASGEIVMETLGKEYIASCSPLRDQNRRLKFILHTITEITDLKHAEMKIEALLAEKDLILKEVHHRLKNNMAAAAAMLSLQANEAPESSAASVLEDAAGRINSMALLYERLYRSNDVSELSVSEYLSALVDSVLGNFPWVQTLVVEKDIADFVLDAKRLQILGIIANELLTNTMKYAFEGRKAGEIMVVARLDGNLIHFSVRDNGVGIGQHGGAGQSSGFGFTLVHGLAKQLDAELRVERKGGTKVVLEFGR